VISVHADWRTVYQSVDWLIDKPIKHVGQWHNYERLSEAIASGRQAAGGALGRQVVCFTAEFYYLLGLNNGGGIHILVSVLFFTVCWNSMSPDFSVLCHCDRTTSELPSLPHLAGVHFGAISGTFSTEFGQLILSKIVKIVATRCHILMLKCTKFNFSCCSAPDSTIGAHVYSPDLLAAFKGSYF